MLVGLVSTEGAEALAEEGVDGALDGGVELP
jgi:hypothetical protein